MNCNAVELGTCEKRFTRFPYPIANTVPTAMLPARTITWVVAAWIGLSARASTAPTASR